MEKRAPLSGQTSEGRCKWVVNTQGGRDGTMGTTNRHGDCTHGHPVGSSLTMERSLALVERIAGGEALACPERLL